MKVTATRIGFYGKLRKVGEEFSLSPRDDSFIIKLRKEASDKKVSDAERKADVQLQLGSWMKEVKA